MKIIYNKCPNCGRPYAMHKWKRTGDLGFGKLELVRHNEKTCRPCQNAHRRAASMVIEKRERQRRENKNFKG